jgi:hypothetical protein
MRTLGVVVLLGMSCATWEVVQIAKSVYQPRPPWARWAQARRRQFLIWCAIVGLSSIGTILGTYSAFTGNIRVGQWLLAGIVPLISLLFIPQPCGAACFQTDPWRRGLRAVFLIALGGASIYFAVEIGH